MARGREPAAAAQHHLGAHEFAVVFAEGPLHRAKAGIGAVGTGGPLPQHPVGVLHGSAMQAKGVFPFRFGGEPGTAPAGSGVYFSENDPTSKYILTAAHVISRATDIEIVDYSGRTLSAVIHAIDERRDIAFLKTEVKGPVIPLGIGKIPIGSHVCAIGNSFGLGHSLSCGVVSAVNRQNIGFNELEDFIQTDAAINPGSSGGALIDSEGRFVGLIDGIFTKDADIDAGVNFAISLTLIRASLADMRMRGVRFDEIK